MGGKVWSAEEEKYFWGVIVPQAPAGLDAVSKQAKKDAHKAWAPLSLQMEREMVKRLKPEECLRRKYTPIGCYEHYFQNYINRHYSPHAKALVLKYQGSLEAATSTESIQSTTDDDTGHQMSPEPIPGPSRASAQATRGSNASRHMSHNNGAGFAMPEAPMPLEQVQGGSTSMQVLCDAALTGQEFDAVMKEEGDKEDEVLAGSSRRNRKKSAIVILEDADDKTAETSGRTNSRSEKPSQRENRETQRNQRRTRKITHRHAQVSDVGTQTAILTPALPPPGGFYNVPTGYCGGPMMYGPQPAFFGHHYGMQPGAPPIQNANVFQSNHAIRTNGFHPYGDPSQFSAHPQSAGVPRFNGPTHLGFGGPFPPHAVPFMGGYYNPGYIHNSGQGFENDSAYKDGSNRGMSGNVNGMSPSSDPVKKDSPNSDNKRTLPDN